MVKNEYCNDDNDTNEANQGKNNIKDILINTEPNIYKTN